MDLSDLGAMLDADGLFIQGPARLDVSERASAPLRIVEVASLAALQRAGFARHGIVIAAAEDGSDLRAARAFATEDERADEAPAAEGRAARRVEIDLRARLGLPWCAGAWHVRAACLETTSAPLRLELHGAAPGASAVSAPASAIVLPPGVFVPEREPGGPAAPSEGVLLHAPRVVVEGSRWTLGLAFRDASRIFVVAASPTRRDPLVLTFDPPRSTGEATIDLARALPPLEDRLEQTWYFHAFAPGSASFSAAVVSARISRTRLSQHD